MNATQDQKTAKCEHCQKQISVQSYSLFDNPEYACEDCIRRIEQKAEERHDKKDVFSDYMNTLTDIQVSRAMGTVPAREPYE